MFTRHRRKPDKHSIDQESLSRQRSTYTELFTQRRRKPDKHSTDQESLSRQRSTYTELFTRRRRKPDKHSTNQESLSRQRPTNTKLFTRRGHPGKEDINKNKESSFNLYPKRSRVFYYRSWSTKVNYIKHCHQEKKYQY